MVHQLLTGWYETRNLQAIQPPLKTMDALNSLPTVKALLQDGVDKGYWKLSDPGSTDNFLAISNTRVDRRFFKDGYNGIQHRNLLRDSNYTPKPDTTTDDLPF